MSVQRYFTYLAYDGTHYHGWQTQPSGVSVQKCLTRALAAFLRKDMEMIGVGRTDAEVHASLMVAHFDYEGEALDMDRVAEKLNRLLPQDISVYKVRRVRSDAHARFDATARTCKYYTTTAKYSSNRQYYYRIHNPLNFQKANEAALTLFHYTDFTGFNKLHTDVKTDVCKIMHVEWTREDEYTRVLTIQADRFLCNMVCVIVNTLLEVGRGKLFADDFRRIIEQQNRCKAGTSTPGNTLSLVNVEYSQDVFE